MRTKKRIRLKGRLRIYMQTSLYMGILLLIVDIGTYFLDVRAGFLLTCFLLFYFGMIILLMFYNRPIILNELISFATQYGQVQKTLLRDMAIPYALLDETGRVIWCNDAFRAAIHSEKGFHKSITYVFPAITRERLPQGEQEAEIEISFEESDYIAHITRVSLRGMISEDSDVLDDEDYDSCLYAMYLYDETALKLALRENDAQSLAVGLIYLDNYEEALASVEEVRRSLLKALIDRKVNKYISSFDGICQNIEKDKYLVILKKKSVMQMQEQRFELLEDVKTVNIGNEMAVTLSIGIDWQNFDIYKGDTLKDDKYGDIKMTVQVCNQPYSLKWSADKQFEDDPRYSGAGKLAPKGQADLAFVEHMIYHMDEDDGRVAVLLPHGVLFRGGAEETIRKYIIKDLNRLDAVIGLPANLFHGTGIPVCVLVLKCKRNGNAGNILFIDASKEFKAGKNQNVLEQKHIDKIVETYEKRVDVDKFAHVAEMSEIVENGYNLNIPRYVDTFEEEEPVDLEAVRAEIKRLDAETKNAIEKADSMLQQLGL